MLFCRRLLLSLLSVVGLVYGFGALQAQSATATTTTPAFSTVVVFGDSLSDTGNIAHITDQQYHVRYPGDNVLLGIDYTDGRFTDGTDTQPAAKAYLGVWIEQLAASLAAKPAIKNSLDGGTNYAFGDATTGAGTTTESKTYGPLTATITLDNMGKQLTDYLADVSNKAAPAPSATTLFVLWGGSNDLLDAAVSGNDPVAAAQTAVTNELAIVQQLVADGATSFMLPNLPPLGSTPEGAASPLAASLNTASAAFAKALAQGIASLQTGFAANGKTVTFYQPDILTLFATVAGNPNAVGLSNLTTAAQNISADPDTYLIWDGLHPTTTGHHLVAATAAALLTPLVTSSTAITAPLGALPGQSVTLSATVTSTAATSSTASTATPTGLVSFFNGTTLLGAGSLDATGTATASFTALAASSPYSITAVYAGDTTYSGSTSQPATLTVISATVSTTTAVSSSNTNADLNSSVTFTATVTPSVTTYGAATGTVSFLDGQTVLGTGTLSNGTATYSTSTLAAGTHSITAVYAGGGVFAGSSSSAISQVVVPPSYSVYLTPTSTTVSLGSATTTVVNATSIGGFSGSFTVACGTMPAHFGCSLSSTTLTVAGDNLQSSIVTITTNGGTTSAALARSGRPGTRTRFEILSASLLFPGFAGLLAFGLRRRRGLHGVLARALVVVLLSAGAVFGLAGCGSSGNGNDAPVGTYTVPLIVTPTSGNTAPQTLNFTVTVAPPVTL